MPSAQCRVSLFYPDTEKLDAWLADNVAHREFWTAIGYASKWNMKDGALTNIHVGFDTDGTVELSVSYFNNANDPRPFYVMGGIWYKDEHRFAFHS